MASPFEIFRRNQWLVVALFGLSIFAFVLLDPLTSGGGGGRLFPIVLGVLLGGVAFWLLSGQTGKAAVAWAGAGAVAGGLFVGLGSDYFGGRTAIATTAGDLSPQDIEGLANRREIATGFFGRLQRNLADEYPEDRNVQFQLPPVRDFAGYVPTMQGNLPTILGPEASRTEDLLFGYLLNREADELGLEVSDAEINRVINEHYGVAPRPGTVRQIRKDFGVGETQLFDAIRSELRARRALELLLPQPAALPADYWTLFRRLNQSADLSLAALPVDDFVAKAPEPTDAEVAALFEEYRGRPADPATGLGFKRPSQIRMGYLRAERAKIAESVPAPTDDDVRAYYEENKEQFRNPAYDDYLTERQMRSLTAPGGEAEAGTGDGQKEETDATPPPAPPTLPSVDLNDAAPATESAAEPVPADEPAMDEEPAELPAPGLPAPAAAAPAAAAGSEPADPPAEQPEDEDPEGDGTASAAAAFTGVAFAAVQDDPGEDDAEQDPPADAPARDAVTAPRPVARAASGDAPADPPAPQPADPPAADAPAAPAMADEPAADAPPAQAMEEEMEDTQEEEEETPDEPAVGEAAPPAPDREPPPEFDPLTPDRVESIRQQLKDARVQEELDRRVTAAAEFMYTLGSDVWAEVPDPENPDVTLSPAEIDELRDQARERIETEMRAYAAENGLEYVNTDFVGVEAFAEDAYPVMLAETGSGRADPFAPRDLAVQSLFENFTGPLFQVVRTGFRPDTGDGFAVWKTDQRYAAEQELTDPGVRDLVVAAFKRQKAAELAAARAAELAKEASREGVTLADAVADQTVTGPRPADAGEDVPALEVQPTGPFTRLRLARPTGPMAAFQPPTPRSNGVPGVGAVSQEFLDAAFDTLDEGEAGVATDADGTVVYVLELNARTPDGENLKELYPDFLRDAATSPGLYARVGDRAAFDSQRAFVNGLFDKYGVSGLDRLDAER